MYRRNRKISIVILSYSLIVTSIIIAIGYFFINRIPQPTSNLPEVIFAPASENVIEAINLDGYVTLDLDATTVSTANIASYYRKEILKYFPSLIIGLLVIVSVSTWFLWKILLLQSDKAALEVANELDTVESDNDLHPFIEQGMQAIKEKMEASNDDYIRLCSYITHEQKNVLALLRAKLQIAGNQDLIKEVDVVADSIDDILTLTAMDNDDNLEIVDVALVCANVCDDYRKVFPNISFEFDDNINTQIKGKELWLYRAIANLLDNAIKYANDGLIKVVIENKKSTVIIKVIDNGFGISIKEQEKLFEDRYRIKGMNKNGYGIGLNLVRHVCDLCNGVVWVDSKENLGTTFYLAFLEALTLD